jgi:signal transduction histidine kinase
MFGKLEDLSQINKEGTGLGLYISNQLVTSLGGSIEVKSEVE